MNVNTYEKLLRKQSKLSVLGLGYVGMPLVKAFSEKVQVIAFDISEHAIKLCRDVILDVPKLDNVPSNGNCVEYTNDSSKLSEAVFHIIAVPTPVNIDKTPDLSFLENACEILGKNLARDSFVVFESTVYPSVTEDVCIPILERASGLKVGTDFKVGYSPERINPSDTKNTLESIVKIVSATDDDALEIIALVYKLIVSAGVYKASSIKIAEAAKLIENSQRDLNVAFLNEISIIFKEVDIDTSDVISAMNTKWNSLKFTPGLVGGHCIGVDPYYLRYWAEKEGCQSLLVSTGRKINDEMSKFVADAIIRKLIVTEKKIKDAKIAIFGITFKENCPDHRNSRAIDIIDILKTYGIQPIIVDPIADKLDILNTYEIELQCLKTVKNMDCLVFLVAHDIFNNIIQDNIELYFKDLPNKEKIIIDVKSIFNKTDVREKGYTYWCL